MLQSLVTRWITMDHCAQAGAVHVLPYHPSSHPPRPCAASRGITAGGASPFSLEESIAPMQTAATEFAEVLKFRFDADIEAADGEAGRLAAVIADSATRAITHAVVKTR